MGIFDKLKNTAASAVNAAVQTAGNKCETFTLLRKEGTENDILGIS